jgi:CheY-like chemotaxis protein
MDGLELIRTIQSTGRRIAIIAVSGGDPSLDLLRAASLCGADAALTKPLDLARLVAVVHSLLAEEPNRTPAPD